MSIINGDKATGLGVDEDIILKLILNK